MQTRGSTYRARYPRASVTEHKASISDDKYALVYVISDTDDEQMRRAAAASDPGANGRSRSGDNVWCIISSVESLLPPHANKSTVVPTRRFGLDSYTLILVLSII